MSNVTIKNKSKKLVLRPVPDFADLRGFLKTKKKYDPKAARKAYIKDVVAGKV